MTTLKRGPGRPPSDDPSVPITFTIPSSDAAWVRKMPAGARSKWLAAHVAADRAAQHATGHFQSPDCAADRAPSAPDAPREAS